MMTEPNRTYETINRHFVAYFPQCTGAVLGLSRIAYLQSGYNFGSISYERFINSYSREGIMVR